MSRSALVLFASSLFLLLSSFFLIYSSFSSLPPEIPLWYTRPWGPLRLGPSQKLYLLPVLGGALLVFNFLIAFFFSKKGERVLAELFALLSLANSSLLALSALRIIRLVGRVSVISSPILSLVQPFSVGLLFSLVLTPLLIRLGRRLRLVDRPHGPYIDVRPLPRLGGVGIFLSFAATALIFLPLDRNLTSLLLGGLLLTVVGTVDDILNLPPLVLGVSHILAALVLVFGGVGITFVSNPLSFLAGPPIFQLDRVRFSLELGNFSCNLPLLAGFFTLVWVFALINIVDWLDGLDGLAAGVGIIASAVILGISVKFHTPVTATLSLALGGVLLGFLLFNFSPARILLGSGGYLLGFLVATLAIYSGGKIATTLLVLALPILDTLLVLTARLRRGQPLYLGDKTHLHHRLLERGLKVRQVVFLEWLLCALLGAAALLLTGWKKLLAIIIVFTAGLIFNQFFGLTVSELKDRVRRGGAG